MFMLEPQYLGQFLMVLFEEVQGAESLWERDPVSAGYNHTTRRNTRLTSWSELFCAAVANSPAARSCSSLAATGFDLRVSSTAFLAWVCAWEDGISQSEERGQNVWCDCDLPRSAVLPPWSGYQQRLRKEIEIGF